MDEAGMNEADMNETAYTKFASIYDIFMDGTPYEKWCDYICEILAENKITDGIIADLGCGTGMLTRLLSRRGYDMIGIDYAEDMLAVAREKQAEADQSILYLSQDMREFELYGTVAAIVSVCDSINYILEEEEILQVFKLVNNYLDPKGLFIFDLNMEYKYQEILGDSIIAENREEGSFIWENFYDSETQINEYELTLFLPEQEDSGLFRKYKELHYQRAYDLCTMQDLLKQAGMECIAIFDAFTREPVRADSERVCIIARESGKT